MSNPTSNFGWQMPTPTDLVTDLPADFEVFGQAVDTSMADLKGGTTGQILSKNSNTDMDFIWIANDQGDITGVTATSPLTGGGTSGAITVGIQAATTSQSGAVQLENSTSSTSTTTAAVPASVKSAYDLANTASTTATAAIPKSTVTAKGSIVAATASSTPANLAVGNNGETLVADSSTSTGLRYQENRTNNFLYNSNFDIWQRGTSFASVSGYSADRWTNSGIVANTTTTRETSGAPAGAKYYVRHTASAGSAYTWYLQYLETNDVEQLWGKTVTFSLKLRRNATMNSNVTIYIDKSATVDANNGATWTTISSTTISNASIPTGTTTADWLTSSVTAAIPNDGTANSIRVFIANTTSTLPSGSVVDYAQTMLQIGSVVAPYQRQNATIQGELAPCQRYYWRQGGDAVYQNFALGSSTTTTAAIFVVNNPVTMRVAPTSVDYSTLAVGDNNTYSNAVTSLSINYAGKNTVRVDTGHSGTATQYRPAFLIANNSTSAYLGMSAEL